ncbi:MAG: Fic family protein [Planctomycetota bacterium]|nr:Fic family protein [Planctomycetota bacterium]
MNRGPTGSIVSGPRIGGEVVRAFVPAPLPPDPPLQIGPELREEIDQALLNLGRLDSVSTLLPDRGLFLWMYVRKEAVLSSQIEGTQSSLSDLLLFEIDEESGLPFDDVREVSCYVRALERGVQRLREGFPLCGRLLREIHAELLSEGRGSERSPGEYRSSQNWIGGDRPGRALFVPPPPEHVPVCMGELEGFLHDQPVRTSVLLKAALAHVQFETIHPFLDGNGRLGRLLTTLILVSEGVLREPLLYLSLYLKTHRATYYDLLQRVRTDGDWEAWLGFFVRGVRVTAEQAVASAQALAELFRADRARIQDLGRAAGSALQVHLVLEQHPIQTIYSAAARTGLSIPTVTSALRNLEAAGIARELTGRQRHKVFGYRRSLDILEDVQDGTAPDQ